MSTIPASDIANVLPNVLAAGGNAINLNGLLLTQNIRVPQNTLLSLTSPAAVEAYFGATSLEAQLATIYFLGYAGATASPGNLLFAQYNQTSVAAYLRGGSLAAMSLQTLQSLNGSLNIDVDTTERSAPSINLSGVASFSAAAATIQTALNASPVQQWQANGSIGSEQVGFNGSIGGNVLNVSQITSGGALQIGGTVTGSGVVSNTVITGQLSGTIGGVGVYAVNNPQTIALEGMTETYGLFTVTGLISGFIQVGDLMSNGTGIIAGTTITALGTGVGGSGTYIVNNSQNLGPAVFTGNPTPLAVAYDSVSGAFVITSGVTGLASSMAYATGTLSGPLNLTAATSAILSQGATPQTPQAFMNNAILLGTNWASFMLNFDPDGGVGNAQKLQFCQWAGAQNKRYAFSCWDTDPNPANINPATSSLGYLIGPNGLNLDGTILTWHPDPTIAAFVMSYAASLNFNQKNGRATLKFRSQAGLVAAVSNPTVAHNLGGNPATLGDRGNGYNFYGVYGTATQSFTFYANGYVSGSFLWADSFYNQIWMNANFQTNLITLLTNIGTIPYDQGGNDLMTGSLSGTIQQAASFGVFRTGIPLSATQIQQVNNQAGNTNASNTLTAQGYYLQILPAPASVRQNRGTPPANFWYCDGQSVQYISLNSVDLL